MVKQIIEMRMIRGVIYVDENQFSDQGKLLLQGKVEDLDNFAEEAYKNTLY